ncbi:MAG: response regulator, partial [Chloroflexi bacterium]|nr:response regulator [Chloroflexota bacterium]
MPRDKPLVLVVDDHVPMQRLAKRILELEGYRVTAVRDGDAALQQFQTAPPDLILLDIMLPGVNGYDVCRQIRQISQVPVVMVTAKGLDEERLKGFEVGADDYVAKPFNPKELAYRVRAVLRRTMPPLTPEPAAFVLRDLKLDHV